MANKHSERQRMSCLQGPSHFPVTLSDKNDLIKGKAKKRKKRKTINEKMEKSIKENRKNYKGKTEKR